MPYFGVMLSGRGISLPFEGSADHAIGFFTTRRVRARDSKEAQVIAKELVLSEWVAGGTYSQANIGAVPSLATDRVWSVGWVRGIFGKKQTGYVFYSNEE